MKNITKTIMYLQMTALFLTGALSGAVAGEKEKPFHGTLQAVETGVVQFPTVFVEGSGTGKATHLGRFTLTYVVTVNIPTLAGIGSMEFIAANGDSVFSDRVGQATPTGTPNVFSIVETHTITGGTGRFAGASGSFIIERVLDQVTGITSGSFEGTIILDHGRHGRPGRRNHRN